MCAVQQNIVTPYYSIYNHNGCLYVFMEPYLSDNMRYYNSRRLWGVEGRMKKNWNHERNIKCERATTGHSHVSLIDLKISHLTP